jgi:multimeric flavodoxin WrbA
MPAYLESDMIVFATPVYYFDMSAQLSAAIQRVYCIGKPAKAAKAAMLISSASPGTGEGAVVSYKNMLAYMGVEDMGVYALAGEECKSEEKLAEIRAFAKGL